jgi:hypothetical protein
MNLSGDFEGLNESSRKSKPTKEIFLYILNIISFRDLSNKLLQVKNEARMRKLQLKQLS